MEEMKMDLGKAIDSKLDRTKWKKWKFSDLVDNIVEKVKPQESGLEHYIGLEHLDSGSLHIKRFGESKTLIGDKLKIYKNDIIFAKRNAYLKRVSIAPFDAVASAHSMVLRPKAENVLPEFLPFFLLSEQFWTRAIEISVGSLSPTINWRVLAKQEFLLPPKDQQAKLAELLWAMDEVIERENEVLEKLDYTYFTLVDNLFSKKKDNWSFKSVDMVASINKNTLNSRTDPDYEFRYLDLSSIVEPKIIGEMKLLQFKDAPSRAKRIVEDNSIVLGMVRPYQKAFVYVVNAKDIIASTGTSVITTNDVELSKFLFHQFFSLRFTKYCERMMTGTSYPAITPDDISQYKVSIPKDSSIIKSTNDKLDDIEKALFLSKSKISSSKALQKSLINQVF